MSPSYPDSIPLIALENKVLLPSVVTKVTIRGREASTLNRKLQSWQDKRQEAYIGCTPLKTPTTNHSDSQAIDDSPSEPSTAPQMPMPTGSSNSSPNRQNLADDLHSFGCLARVIRVERVGFGGYAIFLEGLARFRVQQILQEKPHVLAKVHHYTEEVDLAANGEDGDLANQIAAFRVLSKAFVNKMRDLQLPDPLIAQLSKLMDNSKPGVLANILVSVIETTYEEKLDYLSTTTLKARLIMANEWMTRQLHVSAVYTSNVDICRCVNRNCFFILGFEDITTDPQ
jgi:ATP-dependent Lon protease